MAIKPVLLATIQQLRAQAWGAMPLLALLLGLTFLSMGFADLIQLTFDRTASSVDESVARFGMPRVWRMQLRTDLVVLGEGPSPGSVEPD